MSDAIPGSNAVSVGPPDPVADPGPEQTTQLVAASRAYLKTVLAAASTSVTVDLNDVTITVTTNGRRTRRAGITRTETVVDPEADRGFRVTEQEIDLTWRAYASWGWGDEWAGLLRHELAHLLDIHRRGESDHSRRFSWVAERVDASLSCPKFVAPEDHRYRITCSEGCEDYRDRASTVVKNPAERYCSEHREPLTATHMASERSWKNEDGYEAARAAVEAALDCEW